jgi:exopolyphosphatase / guanosine-5'-triphosphate,3'-diphosphate pyrophosphatase
MALAAVVDVGSNTVRLLVARATEAGPATAHTERIRLDLGHEIEKRGRISDVKLAKAAKAVRTLCSRGRAAGARSLEVIVTAPGRQAENGDEFVAALVHVAQVPVRVLSPDDEARLAFAGAVGGEDRMSSRKPSASSRRTRPSRSSGATESASVAPVSCSPPR